MNSEEFFTEIGDIVVYPGSLSELNLRRDIHGEERRVYEQMDVAGPTKFIQGILIPYINDLENEDLLRRLQQKMLDESTWDPLASNPGESEEHLRDRWERMFGKDYVRALDLRWQAKEMGANGLVEVRLHRSELGLYSGVPIVNNP